MTGVHEWLVIVGHRWMRCSFHQPHLSHLFDRHADRKRSVNFHVVYFCDLAMFRQHPKFFKNFIELLFVSEGKDLLGRDLAVMQLDSLVSKSGHDRIMGYHQNRSSLLVEMSHQP